MLAIVKISLKGVRFQVAWKKCFDYNHQDFNDVWKTKKDDINHNIAKLLLCYQN